MMSRPLTGVEYAARFTLIVLAVALACLCVPQLRAQDPTPQAQCAEVLNALWAQRVTIDGREGFACRMSVDGVSPRLTANESGAFADGPPTWCFQSRDGVGAALALYLHDYRVNRRPESLQRARLLGETLIYAAEAHGGYWPQDVAVIDGKIRGVGVWGSAGKRVHVVDGWDGAGTLDDGTSQSCALALLELGSVTGDARYTAAALRTLDALAALDQPAVPQVMPRDAMYRVAVNDNLNPDSPNGAGYMGHRTYNDRTTADAIVLAVRAAALTGDAKYMRLADRFVDETLRLGPPWAEQYEWDTARPRWGRRKEPGWLGGAVKRWQKDEFGRWEPRLGVGFTAPVFLIGEHGLFETLAWYRTVTTADRRGMIERKLDGYLDWLAGLPRDPLTGKLARYYSHDGAAWQPIFADDYTVGVGWAERSAFDAVPGFWYGNFDAAWIPKLRPAGALSTDWALASRYLADPSSSVYRLNPLNARLAPQWLDKAVGGLWPSAYNYFGTSRQVVSLSQTLNLAWGVIDWAASEGLEPPSDVKPPPVAEPPPTPNDPPPTSDDEWFTAAIAKGGKIELEPRRYTLRAGLNLRNVRGLTIVGSGVGATPTLPASEWSGSVLEFVGVHGVAVDLTGAFNVTFRDFGIVAGPGVQLDAGILCARDPKTGVSAASSGFHRFDRVWVDVHADAAAVAWIGSEVNVADQSALRNFRSGGDALLISYVATPSIVSQFGPYVGGSCVDHRIRDCYLAVRPQTGTETLLRTRGDVGHVWLDGLAGSSKGAVSGESYFTFETDQGYPFAITLARAQCEGSPRYGILTRGPRHVRLLSVEGGSYIARDAGIRFESSAQDATVAGVTWQQCAAQASIGNVEYIRGSVLSLDSYEAGTIPPMTVDSTRTRFDQTELRTRNPLPFDAPARGARLAD